MPIKIMSMQEGFRRCGVAHGRDPKVYPDDRFTREQVKAMQAEPLLRVEFVKDEKKGEKN